MDERADYSDGSPPSRAKAERREELVALAVIVLAPLILFANLLLLAFLASK